MKIRKTSGADTVRKSGQVSRGGSSAERARAVDPSDVTDTVSLSEEAIAAARSDAVDGVNAVGMTEADGPMPDPHETSRAMLKKELERVFRLIYL